MQEFLNFEGRLILVGIGVDIFIEALKNQDWVAAAVIIAGFCIIGGLYWHTLYLDRLFADLHEGIHRILPHHTTTTIVTPPAATTTTTTTVVQDVSRDVPAAAIADRPILHVSNFPLSRNFYAAVLGTLGYTMTVEFAALSMAAFGIGGASDLWIKGDGFEQKIRAAFSATEKHMVDDFCTVALAMDATISEAPGPRPDRGVGYYAAAIIDPDGYTIEAVFYDPTLA